MSTPTFLVGELISAAIFFALQRLDALPKLRLYILLAAVFVLLAWLLN